MAYIFARMKRKLELCCKIKDNNLRFWFDEFVSWWVDTLGSCWFYLGFTALRHKPLSICENTIVKQNCIWKIVVRRMQDVRCMTSITPCAEEKENFCLLTMQLWLSKSNSVWLWNKDNFNYLEPALTPFFACYKPLSQPPISLSNRRISQCALTSCVNSMCAKG